MSGWAYYNEIDPFAAEWIRQLVKRGLIAPGYVDEQDIRDVDPNDIKGYTQYHFFAGIAVWSYALRLAGWPDDKFVMTGSPPCQPFSRAGRRGGFDDERHLFPEWFRIIRELRPQCIFGEQVAGKTGEAWLDFVQDEMESENYVVGSVVTAACGFGAPHQRKRIYFVAERLADARAERLQRGESQELPREERGVEKRRAIGERSSPFGKLAHPATERRFEQRLERCGDAVNSRRPGPTNGFWRDSDWLFCRDGKWRPIKLGTSPLVNRTSAGVGRGGDSGTPDVETTAEARIGRIKGYGNAIVAQQASAFIESYLELKQEQ